VEQSTLESFLGIEKTKQKKPEPEERISPSRQPREFTPEKPRGDAFQKAASRPPKKTVYKRPNGVVVTIVEAPGKPTIIHHDRPGIKLFKEPVKCPVPDCKTFQGASEVSRSRLQHLFSQRLRLELSY